MFGLLTSRSRMTHSMSLLMSDGSMSRDIPFNVSYYLSSPHVRWLMYPFEGRSAHGIMPSSWCGLSQSSRLVVALSRLKQTHSHV
jgi:hypothetical protein